MSRLSEVLKAKAAGQPQVESRYQTIVLEDCTFVLNKEEGRNRLFSTAEKHFTIGGENYIVRLEGRVNSASKNDLTFQTRMVQKTVHEHFNVQFAYRDELNLPVTEIVDLLQTAQDAGTDDIGDELNELLTSDIWVTVNDQDPDRPDQYIIKVAWQPLPKELQDPNDPETLRPRKVHGLMNYAEEPAKVVTGVDGSGNETTITTPGAKHTFSRSRGTRNGSSTPSEEVPF